MSDISEGGTNRRVVLWIISGCTVLCLGIGILAVFLGSSLVEWVNQSPENIAVRLTVPTVVSMDAEYLLVVEIENLANKEQTLDSIEIEFSYLDNVIIGNTEPDYVDYLTYEDGSHKYEFHSPIPAGHTLEVVFYLTAVRAGDTSGEFSVCINSFLSCTNRFIRTIIEE